MLRHKIAQLIIAASLLLGGGMALAPVAHANTFKGDACSGISALGGRGCSGNSDSSIRRLFALIVNILSLVVGVAAIIMVIVGGFKIITSNGDSSNVASGRNTVIYALIGLVIAVLAHFLVAFTIGKTSGVT